MAALIATVSPCNAVKLPVSPTIVLLLPPFIEYVHVGTVYPADGPEGDPEVLRLILLTVDTAEPVKVIVGSISGTALSYGSPILMGSNGSNYVSVDFNKAQAGQFVVAYRNPDGGHNGAARLGQIASSPTNLTSTNFIGISDSAISSGAAGKATIKGGIKTGLSSLTPNAIYYVQEDGTITTASASPAVRIGKALSSTSINLEYNS